VNSVFTSPPVAVRSMALSVSVCLSVCLSVRVSTTTCPNFTKFSVYVLFGAEARSSSNDNGICYVLPVLCMTSCFHIMSHVARGVGTDDVGAVLKQVVKISNVFARLRHAV